MTNLDFRSLRSWRGSQHQAFEELCHQLRDPTPTDAKLVKTGNPDGGVDWYVTRSDGTQWGWQAKFTFNIDTLLKLMEKSLRTVVKKRPECERLTFCIPFDLSDAPEDGQRKSAWQKFEDRKQSWRNRILGADGVRIELWPGGDILERLVQHPKQRGLIYFWWGKEVFSPDWCREKTEAAVRVAKERYSPELHVELPTAFALDGLALSETWWCRYGELREKVLSAAQKVERSSGDGTADETQRLCEMLKSLPERIPERFAPPERAELNPLLDLMLDECSQAVNDAYWHETDKDEPNGGTDHQTGHVRRFSSLRIRLRELNDALKRFARLLRDPATKAAMSGALLVTGEAGQGKTHLFCDAAMRAVDANRPAILIMGGHLSGRSVWSEIAERLGLGPIGSEELIGAMQAAAEASNAPFLLLIDALNEAERPKAWREELPALLAEIADNPWIAIGVSVRSSYRRLVLSDDHISYIEEIEHSGFAERYTEAIERFFAAFDLGPPQTPPLAPEFTNPLFLKLYCETMKGLGPSFIGDHHVTNVFQKYLEMKAGRIADQLELDPGQRDVEKAVGAFVEELVREKQDSLDRDRSAEIVKKFARKRHRWPNTLLGQLLSEGVLAEDLAWRNGEHEQVVRFTYQRLADYRAASVLLAPFDRDRFRQALEPGGPLRKQIQEAPAGWIEALSVLMPERFGVELLDASRWYFKPDDQARFDRAFVQSVTARQPSAVTGRSRRLLRTIKRRSGLSAQALEALLTVAPSPEHPLNAEFLHDILKRRPMPERDVDWSVPTYFAFDDPSVLGGTLDRLIRWAARGPYPDCGPEMIELAALPLVWTFTSPNRRMRDYVTKALVRLLSGSMKALPPLIRRFDGVDDPYVIERLAVVSHGAVLCGGIDDLEAAANAAEEIRRIVFADAQTPNIVTRDAVRGVCEWCLCRDLIDDRTYEEASPPYGSAPPGKPSRTAKKPKRSYGGQTSPHEDIERPYMELFYSIFGVGDFGRYVIESKIRHFSRIPLSSKRWRNARIKTHDPELQRRADESKRWIFERVLSLGWTPAAFAAFDRDLPKRGRSPHKVERFGKKYQWIAFRELLARLADNFHMTDYMKDDFDDQPPAYAGPWEFFGRDIDPTLPPSRRERDEHGDFESAPTFPPDRETWWIPPGPEFGRNDRPVDHDWATRRSDLPKFEPLVWREGKEGIRWVALRAYWTWEDTNSCQQGLRRHIGGRIYSWLVHPDAREAFVADLVRRTWTEPQSIEHVDAAYLGELPWAAAAREGGLIEETRFRPTWDEYLWEGNALDCSIDKGVDAFIPALALFEAGSLAWSPGTREWRTPDGILSAQYRETYDRDSGVCTALLVREDWLKRTIGKTGHSVAFGWFGEKMLRSGSDEAMLSRLGWSEIRASASLADEGWQFGKPRTKVGRLPKEWQPV